MPEPPDFDQIARRVADETGVGRLEEWDTNDPARVVTAIVEQLRQVWNARGAADAKAVHARTIELVAGEIVGAGIARHFAETIHALDMEAP